MEKATTMASVITGKTMVPISLVISLLGGGGWLTTVHSTVQQNAKAIEKIEAAKTEEVQLLRRINERLSRIEGKLGIGAQ